VKGRFDSLARRSGRRVVGARAKLEVPGYAGEKKKACGVDHPAGFLA
jgi:hypothetical protein